MDDLTVPPRLHRGGRAAGLRGEVDLRLARGRQRVLAGVSRGGGGGVLQLLPRLQLLRLRPGLTEAEGQQAGRTVFSWKSI